MKMKCGKDITKKTMKPSEKRNCVGGDVSVTGRVVV
jgi:hypothetical protein